MTQELTQETENDPPLDGCRKKHTEVTRILSFCTNTYSIILRGSCPQARTEIPHILTKER